MLKVMILALGLICATSLAARAEEPNTKPVRKGRPQLTEEQKAAHKAILEKYDTNKDGKLDADERKSISQDDREKLKKAGLGPRRKKDK